jgi:hypothetical protein
MNVLPLYHTLLRNMIHFVLSIENQNYTKKQGALASQQNLKRHLKIHDGTTFFCPSCTQYFDSVEKLNKHKIDKHSYNHLCTFCGKKTFSGKCHIGRNHI